MDAYAKREVFPPRVVFSVIVTLPSLYPLPPPPPVLALSPAFPPYAPAPPPAT